jgi:hypothetical protein
LAPITDDTPYGDAHLQLEQFWRADSLSLITAADASTASMVEAAIDDVTIIAQYKLFPA